MNRNSDRTNHSTPTKSPGRKPNRSHSKTGGSVKGRPQNNASDPNKRRRRDGKPPSRSVQNNSEASEPKKVAMSPPALPKTYAVLFFATLDQAKDQLPVIQDKASQVDQLNIVIRAEANMDDPDLNQWGKVFAGQAWALIHDRRHADGWYDKPR